MSRNLRIYYYTVLGAIGGLLAWRLTDLPRFLDQPRVYLNDALLGAATVQANYNPGGVRENSPPNRY